MLLKKFIQKCRESEPKLAERDTRQETLMEEYNQIVWVHSLYRDLFQDLVKLPYLTHLFPKEIKYRLRANYDINPDVTDEEEPADISTKVSQGIMKKGVGTLAEKIFTRTILFKASSLAIRLNPLAMATSYLFSELLEVIKKTKKEDQLIN